MTQALDPRGAAPPGRAPGGPAASAAWQAFTVPARVAQLEAVFRDIAVTRMADVPICHPGLRVQAVGFEALESEPAIAFGVLVTPWFMNLVRLPLDGDMPAALRERESARRAQLGHSFEFLGAHEPALGAFESCSLYSPMFEFADHDAAVATAREVLAQLRSPPGAAELAEGVRQHRPDHQGVVPRPAQVQGLGAMAAPGAVAGATTTDATTLTTTHAATPTEPVPSRRGFLLGRMRGPGHAA